MNSQQLFEQIEEKRSFLCVGLDSDINKIPRHLLLDPHPVFKFNKQIIEATIDYTVCYKLNTAFYEALGIKGWESLACTIKYLRLKHPDVFIIADAKRGDIGNTSAMYAEAFFKEMDVDAVTLSPYMGSDTVMPFLEYEDKWAVLLALTSNPSAADFELLETTDGDKVFEKVIKTSSGWGNADNTMYVVGATKAEMLSQIRRLIPDHFLLVPGVGAQGGSLHDVARYGMNSRCGLLVNSSRGIIFADSGTSFDLKAAKEAHKMQTEMSVLLKAIL